MKTVKAQVSLETIVIFVFMLIIFSLVIISASNRQIEAGITGLSISMNDECQKFSNIIASVFSLGNGTFVSVNTGYSITVSGDGIVSVSDLKGNIVHCAVPVNASRSSGITGRIIVKNTDSNVSLGVTV